MELEGLATTYWELITTSSNPSRELAQFYNSALGARGSEELNRYIFRQVKLYGRDLVFHAILDIAGYEKVNDVEKPYGLLKYFLNYRMKAGRNNDGGASKSPNLDEFVMKVKKEKEELKNSE